VKKYVGIRTSDNRCIVTVNGSAVTKLLPDARELWCHSHSGYEWGYTGSGPAQLALALLFDATGSAPLALHFYQRFKFEVVCKLPEATWSLQVEDITAWLLLKLESTVGTFTEYDMPDPHEEVWGDTP